MYTDSTKALIGFETISFSVQEGAGVAVLYVSVLNGALDRNVTVWFSTTDLSATGEPYTAIYIYCGGVVVSYMLSCSRVYIQVCVFCDSLSFYIAEADYTSTMRLLTFNRSSSRIAVQVPILHDEFTELNEQFRASLSLVNGNGFNVILRPDQSTVKIIDDDSKWKRKNGREEIFLFSSPQQELLLDLLRIQSQ